MQKEKDLHQVVEVVDFLFERTQNLHSKCQD